MGNCENALRVTNIKVVPHGTYVDISFATTKSALPIVTVSNQSYGSLTNACTPKEDNKNFTHQPIVSSNFAGIGKTHKTRLSKLWPGRRFYFVIAVHDKESDVWVYCTSSFETLKRKVTVTFEEVKINSFIGEDMRFGFAVNDRFAPNGSKLVAPSDGSVNFPLVWFPINVSATIKEAPEELAVRVRMGSVVKDGYPWAGFPDPDPTIAYEGTYSPSKHEDQVARGPFYYMTLHDKYYLTEAADGEDPDAAVSKNVTLKTTTTNWPNRFEVKFKYRVSYYK